MHKELFSNRCAVDLASNGTEGLEKLKQKTYEVIIMDLQMPDIDGYTGTRIIRQEMKISTPILTMTAHSIVGEKEKCLADGMNDFLSKPFKQEELFHKISDLMFKDSDKLILEENDQTLLKKNGLGIGDTKKK